MPHRYFSIFVPKCLVQKCNFTDHSESDVGLLERGSVIRTIPSHSHHFPRRVESRVDDSFDQSVLVGGRGASEHAKARPHLVDVLLFHLLSRRTNIHIIFITVIVQFYASLLSHIVA